ncbi:hypothetical protein Fmac_009078 [Flemingia macrophylla]|uniref:Transmembrane protein n=1 Tax=Flemingia macrophylla TaxID=520843 RepID=A0ABD1MZB2_9FABA
MANLNQTFKCMCTITLFIIFLLSYATSSTQEIQLQNPSSTIPSTQYYQVFYLKNTHSSATFFTKQERFKKRRIKRNKNHMKQRQKMIKNMQQSRSFSAMLPKGFVPPSGSSPCHNDQPNSLSSFHCHLSTAQP